MHDAVMCAYCGMSFDKEKAKSDMLSMQQQLEAVQTDNATIRKENAAMQAKQEKFEAELAKRRLKEKL